MAREEGVGDQLYAHKVIAEFFRHGAPQKLKLLILNQINAIMDQEEPTSKPKKKDQLLDCPWTPFSVVILVAGVEEDDV